MSDISREEVAARLETIEARTETRFVQIDGKLDRLADHLEALHVDMGNVREDNKSTRTTIIVVVIASVLAGLAAIWATQ